MKKRNKVLLIIVLLAVLLLIICKMFSNNKESKEEIRYYSYEGDGQFVMSSTAHKVDDFTKLKNNYYIKERIIKEKAKEEIVEVFYNDFQKQPLVYGYYTKDEFNKYFQEQVKKGLVCDNKTEVSFGEGVNIKCLTHDKGFEYEKIDSELCVYLDTKEVCVKANDWHNISNYQKVFQDAGWVCEYQSYDTGKWSEDTKPLDGHMECSKEKPSEKKSSSKELFCSIETDGSITCNNNDGWCSIGSDLNTYCFGVN